MQPISRLMLSIVQPASTGSTESLRHWRTAPRGAALVIAVLLLMLGSMHQAHAAKIAAGFDFSCALAGHGTVKCWGGNSVGQLGIGEASTDRSTPVTVSDLHDAAAIFANWSRACAVTSSGKAKCWGSFWDGQFDPDRMATIRWAPEPLPNLTDVTSLALGSRHTCALLGNGGVNCWGENPSGQVGVAKNPSPGSYEMTPVPVQGLGDVTALAVGDSHSCALLRIGEVHCWGGRGRLGDNSRTDRAYPGPVPGLADVIDIVAGASHTCVLTSDGLVHCWGRNYDYQLGDGTIAHQRDVPAPVAGLSDVIELAAGDRHTCARSSNGAAYCWGYRWGLGDGTWDAPIVPVRVSGLENVAALAGGHVHTCAKTSGGAMWCWGRNFAGQLGDGYQERQLPVAVSDLDNATKINAGSKRTCAIVGTGALTCWGVTAAQPLQIPNLNNVVEAALSESHACALTGSGLVKCWGQNENGQLGDGTTTASDTPVSVAGPLRATTIATGGRHTCAVTHGGAVECWGANVLGRPNPTTPTRVIDLVGVTAVAAGRYHTCALLENGTVQCWGMLNGVTSSSVPEEVPGLTDVAAIAAGLNHNCALLRSGKVKCWGLNNNGQIGDGTLSSRETPVVVSDVRFAVGIAAGDSHSCALTSVNQVKCWGRNDMGQLGDGTIIDRLTPIMVQGVTDAISVTAGKEHTCALREGGRAQCWGAATAGQLGNGDRESHVFPRHVLGTPFATHQRYRSRPPRAWQPRSLSGSELPSNHPAELHSMHEMLEGAHGEIADEY